MALAGWMLQVGFGQAQARNEAAPDRAVVEDHIQTSIDQWESRKGATVSPDLEQDIKDKGADAIDRWMKADHVPTDRAFDATDRAIGLYLDDGIKSESRLSLDWTMRRNWSGFSPVPFTAGFPIDLNLFNSGPVHRFGILVLITNSTMPTFMLNGRSMPRSPPDKYVVPGTQAAIKVEQQGKSPCERVVTLDVRGENRVECLFP